MTRPLALLTDFGLQDSYVGVMKGVIDRIDSTINVIDITHAIRPQDVSHGAYILANSAPYFRRNTVFCCIVDPGVGSARLPIAVRADNRIFVAPDNGLLTLVLKLYTVQKVVALTNSDFHLKTRSATFHGRDIFAPVAAHLANGKPIEEMGESLELDALKVLEMPVPARMDNKLIGSIIHIDHFGNLITSLRLEHLGAGQDWYISLNNVPVTQFIQSTFAEVAYGAPLAYIGSDGYLEIAVRNGSAAKTFNATVGMAVRLAYTAT